jgi:hypothetical protein
MLFKIKFVMTLPVWFMTDNEIKLVKPHANTK